MESARSKGPGRRAGSVLGIGLVSIGMAAAASRTESTPAVTIGLLNSAQVPVRTLSKTQNQVSYILAKAGVQVTWLSCPRAAIPEQGGNPCSGQMGAADFVVDVEARKPAGTPAESLGATPVDPVEGRCGKVASVYYSAVLGMRRAVDDIPGILAAALAHEIGHLLLGPKAHSDFGVMSPHWSKEELRRAGTGQLLFTAAEAARLRLAVKSQSQGSRASGAPARLDVAVFDHVGVPADVMSAAVELALQAFHRAGIETDWPVCDPEKLPPHGCTRPLPSVGRYLPILVMPRMVVRPSGPTLDGELAGYTLTGSDPLRRLRANPL
jgi:hypothetical protein